MGELSLANHIHSGYAASNHTHSEYASSSHNHSASEIISGTLPLSRGGTGVTSIDDLKTALGISSSSGVNFKTGVGTSESIPVNSTTKIVICINNKNPNCSIGIGIRGSSNFNIVKGSGSTSITCTWSSNYCTLSSNIINLASEYYYCAIG